MRRSLILAVAIAAVSFACSGSDTVTGVALTADPAPAPVTCSATGIQMPLGLAIHVHVTGTDAKGSYGGGFVFRPPPQLSAVPVLNDPGSQDFIVFAIAPGTGFANVDPQTSGDKGDFSIAVTVTP
jgi:hypothetical protein